MKETSFILLVVFLACLLLITGSCKKQNSGNVVNISQHNSTKSTGMSGNCMSCHKQGGTGEGWFTVAGTVFDTTLTSPNPNGTVTLYDVPNSTGNIVTTIEVDGNGNFYTTENIDLSGGVYPSVASVSGNKEFMPSATTTGACNSCHGISVDPIRVN